VAKMVASDNGVTGIEFVQGVSTGVSFAERADVVVSDLRGVLPLYGGHLHSVIDARERLLAPGGTLVPAADALHAAVVAFPDRYEALTARVSADGTVKLDALRRFMTNTWEKARVTPEQLVTPPAVWATIDYRTVTDVDVRGTAALVAAREATAHGLVVWFDTTLADGITLSNAPGQPELVYGAAFFPWPEPVALRTGDSIRVRFEARHVGGEYLWRWDSEVSPSHAAADVTARFQQSSFYGEPLVPARLARGDARQATVLNEDGRVERFILQAMDGAATNEQIARSLTAKFPERFRRFSDALGRVGAVARRFV
jgi:protein arginine N-methyltransferase 1